MRYLTLLLRYEKAPEIGLLGILTGAAVGAGCVASIKSLLQCNLTERHTDVWKNKDYYKHWYGHKWKKDPSSVKIEDFHHRMFYYRDLSEKVDDKIVWSFYYTCDKEHHDHTYK